MSDFVLYLSSGDVSIVAAAHSPLLAPTAETSPGGVDWRANKVSTACLA